MTARITKGLAGYLITVNKGKRKRPILQSGYQKEGIFVVKHDINTVINKANKQIYTIGKFTPELSEVYNDLFKGEQNTSLYKNAGSITIEIGCESDICLDKHDTLSILEDLQ